jgi:hypothetical protein
VEQFFKDRVVEGVRAVSAGLVRHSHEVHLSISSQDLSLQLPVVWITLLLH